MPVTASNTQTPFSAFHFDSGVIVVTAVENGKDATGFALFRAPENFARDERDYHKASRSLSFRVQSLDLPCFHFIWPPAK